MNPNEHHQQPEQSPAPQPSGMPPVGNNGWQNQSLGPNGSSSQAESRTSYGVDYLNQIAPKEQKSINKFAVIALIGGVLISALFGIIIIGSSAGPSANEQLPLVAARIDTLKTVTEKQQPHLKETVISEANASLNSSLTSMNTDIKTILDDRKIKLSEKSNSSKKEKAYTEALTKTLDESYQRGTLDQIYTSQMTYELTLLKSSLSKLQRSTKNEEITGFTKSATQNIDTILNVYDKFESSKTT